MPAVVNSRRNELNSLGSRKWQLLVRLARCRPNRSRFGYVEFCLTSGPFIRRVNSLGFVII